MSEIRFGEFEIDPDSIPNPPQVQTGTPLVFEIEAATRKEVVKEDTGKTVWVELQCRPVEQPEALLYASLFVTERFLGKPHKSWKNFLVTMGLDPKTTNAASLVRTRFKGVAGEDRKSDDSRIILVKVLGPAY